MSAPIVVKDLNKNFRGVQAVSDLSFSVEAGRITGFLGPNGAGKTTTLRCLLGLVSASSGDCLINGSRYQDIVHPPRTIGAVLEATGFHPARTAQTHLRIQAASVFGDANHPRVNEMIDFVGLPEAAKRKVGGFSLGMRQRLALAMAMLADPQILVLDEPTNGLDPAGIAWLRELLRYLADEGRTILVSSHLLAEVRQSVDDVVIVNKGKLVRSGSLSEVLATRQQQVCVAGPDLGPLREALETMSLALTQSGNEITVTGISAAEVGHLAYNHQVELHRLEEAAPDLEQEFLRLTEEATDQNTNKDQA